MNVVAAPFLYVMPEVDAFYCFSQFVRIFCPLYFHPGIEGAFAGLKLLDEILKLVDPELYAYLISKGQKGEVYAMPPILSFSASSPPLEEVLKLWDFLFAFGVHLNIVCVASQIVCIREELLKEEKPNRLLRTMPPLEANLSISLTVQLVRQLPEELYEKLVVHPYKSSRDRKYNTLPKNFKGFAKSAPRLPFL
jgi:cell cycle arrest protein BUB2